MADLCAGFGRECAQSGDHRDRIEEAELDAGEPDVFSFVVDLAAGEEERERVFGNSGDLFGPFGAMVNTGGGEDEGVD